MTEEEKKITAPTKDNKPKRPARSTGNTLSILMSLTALSISAFVGYQLLTSELPQTAQQLASKVERLKQRGNNTHGEVEQLKENQKTLTEAIRKASQHLSLSRVSWVMAESEQLMIIANQRLQLAGDIDTATTALEIADQRLRDLADPDLTQVRKILAKEIQTLKSTERVDIAGIALRLSALADAVDSLPLSLEFQQLNKQIKQKQLAKKPGQKKPDPKKSPAATKPEPKGFFSELWGDIMSVISIRTNVESYKPLLPPEKQYFLRENLRLMILGAQQAALRADHNTYRNNLKSAKRWAQEYFDTRSKSLAHLIKEIDVLSKARLATAHPNISASLKALRKVSSKRAGL